MEDGDVSKQSVWMACFKEGSYSLVSYRFVEQSFLLQNMLEYQQRRDLQSKLARPKLCAAVSVLGTMHIRSIVILLLIRAVYTRYKIIGF